MELDELSSLDELDGRVWRGRSTRWARAALPTGFAALDSYLPGGGWPLGGLIEVFVERYGIGELTLLIPAFAALTRAGPQNNRKWIAWIAPPFVPYAPALKQRGVDVAAMLLVQPATRNKDKDKDCLWAVEQVIRSGIERGGLGLAGSSRRRGFAAATARGGRARLLDGACSGRSPHGVNDRRPLCASAFRNAPRQLGCRSINVEVRVPASSTSPKLCEL